MACLKSLVPLIDDRTKVLVVDNGSSDGTADAVRSSFPAVGILRNAENLGFPGGNNVGIRHALRQGADYIVLLNNDTVVDGNFVRALLAAAAERPDAGFLSSKIYYYDRPDVLWFAGGRYSTATGRSVQIGYGEKDRGQYDSLREIDRPCGCAVMASRTLLEKVGLMDESLFLYGEEIEWALRAREQALRSLYVPGSKVWHRISRSSEGERSGKSYYYAVRNTLYILNRHALCRLPLLNAARNVIVVLIFLASIFTMRIALVRGIRNVFRGVADYRRGIMGRRDGL